MKACPERGKMVFSVTFMQSPHIDETNQGRTPFHFPFHKSAYVKIPEVDMAMIEQDYRYIRDCVNEGRYSDLHESEAHYLSPCPKNGGRAFSFKPS